MLTFDVKRKINTLRDILVGKVPDPKAQVEQITIALIYKFMDDMDIEGLEFGGTRQFFTGEYEKYAWTEIMKPENSGQQRAFLYAEGIEKMATNPNLPQLFRDIFRGAYIPYRDPDTLNMFLKEVSDFSYDNSEDLGILPLDCLPVFSGAVTFGKLEVVGNQPLQSLKSPQQNALCLGLHLFGQIGVIHPVSRLVLCG